MHKTHDQIENEEGEQVEGPLKLRVDCHFGKRKRLAAIRTCTSHVQVRLPDVRLCQLYPAVSSTQQQQQQHRQQEQQQQTSQYKQTIQHKQTIQQQQQLSHGIIIIIISLQSTGTDAGRQAPLLDQNSL